MRACGYKPSAHVADTSRMWTKSIWGGIPFDQIQAGEREGWVLFDDFINMPDLAVDDAKDTIYGSFGTASGSIAQGTSSEYGELVMTTAAADNDEMSIITGGNVGGLAKFINPATSVPHTIAFECRIKVSTLVGSAYVGFVEEATASAAGFLSATGTIPDKDCVGFFLPEADPADWDFVYNKSGGADPTTSIASVHTAVADTYVKFGLLYNYLNPNNKQIKVFKNGVINSSYVTRTNIQDSTNFPAGEELALTAIVKNVTDIKSFTMDWWRAALVVNA